MRVPTYCSNCWLVTMAFSTVLCVSSVVEQTVRYVVTPSSSYIAAMTPDERRAWEDYNKAWQGYSAAAGAYWNSITERRQLRNGKRARGEQLSVSDYVL